MKKQSGSSTFKFFTQWVIEKIKNPTRSFLVTGMLMTLAFGANLVPQAFRHSSKNESPALTSEENPSRAPSSVEKPVEEKTEEAKAPTHSATGRTVSNDSRSSSESAPNYSSPASSSGATPQHSGSSASAARGGGGSNNSADNTSSQTHSPAAASPSSSSNTDSGVTSTGGNFDAFPSTNPPFPGQAASVPEGGSSASSSGVPGFNFLASSGFQASSGGEICTAPNLQAMVSIGDVTDAGVKTAPGMMFVSGIQGVYYGH